MEPDYVQQRDGGWYVANTRVQLGSVVYAFLRGESPESIVDGFPFLTLEQVFGALAYYLRNRVEVDAWLAGQETEYERMREASRRERPEFYARLGAAREAQRTTQ